MRSLGPSPRQSCTERIDKTTRSGLLVLEQCCLQFCGPYVTMSEFERCLITIPSGIWHANRNIGETELIVMNFPTTAYDHTSPDKFELPLDTKEIPVELGSGWVGF